MSLVIYYCNECEDDGSDKMACTIKGYDIEEPTRCPYGDASPQPKWITLKEEIKQ